MTRAEQDELIVSHLPQAYGIAALIYNRIGRRMPLEDLQQYGALGLVKAAAASGCVSKPFFRETRSRGRGAGRESCAGAIKQPPDWAQAGAISYKIWWRVRGGGRGWSLHISLRLRLIKALCCLRFSTSPS